MGKTVPDASVIIPTYNRVIPLLHNLGSLEDNLDVEIIVLNDGREDDGTKEAVTQLKGITYVFTGHRNIDGFKWRVPGFPNNIGAKLAKSELLIFCCAEIYHPSTTITFILNEFKQSPSQLIGPHKVRDDWDGNFLNVLSDGGDKLKAYERMKKAPPSGFMPNPFVPFCMGMPKQVFMEIGGYDEDFIGIGDDDNDLVERMVAAGCPYKFIDFEVVHLYHGPKKSDEEFFADPRFQYNRQLWKSRKGQIVRNAEREWGIL